MSDRYLHSDRAAVIYIARQRDGIKRQRHQKAAKNFFFFFFFLTSFHCCLSNLSIPPTPNHQPSGLACHCWVSLFSFRGAPDPFFSLLLSSLGESAVSSEHAGVTSRLTSLYWWGQGQVSSQDSPEGRGPGLAMPCGPHALNSLSACPHLLPPPLGPRASGGQQPICKDTWLSTGGEISFTRAPVIWTVTNEASLVTSTDEQPQAGSFWVHCSTANDTNCGSDSPAPALACF